MAWVKELGKPAQWIEGKPYTGAIVSGRAWNCPEEKECPKRTSTHAFSLNIAPLHKRPKIILIQTCRHWDMQEWICREEDSKCPKE